jgi:uncharacterized protein YbcI
MKTKNELEAEITEAIIRYDIEYMGRGPREARTYVVDDLILVRLKGVLTPAEQQLSTSAEGVELVKNMRSRLRENSRAEFSRVIRDATGVAVRDILTDISTTSNERVFIFILESNLGKQLQQTPNYKR